MCDRKDCRRHKSSCWGWFDKKGLSVKNSCLCKLAMSLALAASGLSVCFAVRGVELSGAKPAYPWCSAISSNTTNPEELHASIVKNLRCVDLTRRFSPADISSKNYAASELQLKWHEHSATAYTGIGGDTILNDIAVTPSGRLVAVGGPGLQVVSNDGQGKTWHVVRHTPFGGALFGVTVLDDKRAFSVGGNREILRTQDGQDWEQFNQVFTSYTDPGRLALSFGNGGGGKAFDVAFSDPDHGIVVGQSDVCRSGDECKFVGEVLRTIDGGQRWVPVTSRPLGNTFAFTRVIFVNASEGWVAGSQGALLHTIDGGEHWNRVLSLEDPDAKSVNFGGLSFNSTKHGCVGGSYKVWCTWDGGIKWKRAKLELPQGLEGSSEIGITRLLLPDDFNGWLITKQGLILRTDNGGSQWKLWMNVAETAPAMLTGVQLTGLALGRERVWVVGGADFEKNENADASQGKSSMNSSSLILSWPL
ncbi:hypothetical protein F7R13_05680 [Burkholderia territorii]|uniref:Uncharacterized protein n=2 Tax=Burkholderia territorii TaxID=1503055 RepID=A0A6L3NM37_9BURK|nr:hypothetical protein F7R13_05680 [Burkholderia territorii]VWB42007.1 glycosyl hydrolase BNR repeat-containing glycosyl hydrolase [Burkholderia territorii]